MEAVILKIWHHFGYKGHSSCGSGGKQMHCLQVYGRFWKFLEVLQSCKMLQLGVHRWAQSLLYADTLKLYLVVRFGTNVMNFHQLPHELWLTSCLSEK